MSTTESGRRVGPAETYAPVPGEILAHPELGPAAVRIWAYSWWRLGLSSWILRKEDIQRRCRVGENAWKRAIQELTDAGLYRLIRSQLAAGSVNEETGKKIGGQKAIEHVFFWPGYGEKESPSPTAPPKPLGRSQPAPVVSGRRSTTPRRPGGIRTNKNKIDIQEEEAEATRASKTATAASHKEAEVRPSGIWCVEPDDPTKAETVEAESTQQEIEKAVTEVRSQLTPSGKARWPTPGPVWDAILRARKVQQQTDRLNSGPLVEARRREIERQRRMSDPLARQAANAAMQKAAIELGIHLRVLTD